MFRGNLATPASTMPWCPENSIESNEIPGRRAGDFVTGPRQWTAYIASTNGNPTPSIRLRRAEMEAGIGVRATSSPAVRS